MKVMCIRLIIIYILTVMSIRLMGKRQLGELELSELVTAIFISEFATYPVTDTDVPLIFGIIPVIALLMLEILFSFCSTKSSFVKKMFYNPPCILINKGKIEQKALAKTRITLEELISNLRLKEISILSDVEYAILEGNGQISVVKRFATSEVTKEDMNIESKPEGMEHILVIDGCADEKSLEIIGRDSEWLDSKIRDEKLKMKEIFLMTINDASQINIVRKEL